MPEIEFFFVDGEMESLLDHALELGFEFTPSLHYPTPVPARYTTREEILQFLPDHWLWYLSRKDFSHLPFSMKGLDGGPDEGKYYIVQREGGPMIHLSWSGIRTKESVRFVRWGNLSHYPTFYFPESKHFERAPETLRGAYKQLATWIRANSVPSENPIGKLGRPIRATWIGKEAARAWSNGLHLGPPDDESRRPKFVPTD